MVLCGLWFCGGGAAGFVYSLFLLSRFSVSVQVKRFSWGEVGEGVEIFLLVVCEREGEGVWFSPVSHPGVLSAKNPPS